jgi:hypothetical protein
MDSVICFVGAPIRYMLVDTWFMVGFAQLLQQAVAMYIELRSAGLIFTSQELVDSLCRD